MDLLGIDWPVVLQVDQLLQVDQRICRRGGWPHRRTKRVAEIAFRQDGIAGANGHLGTLERARDYTDFARHLFIPDGVWGVIFTFFFCLCGRILSRRENSAKAMKTLYLVFFTFRNTAYR